jgi:pSer/pThr/pTyr-binding forkhead associated (FHA) protein
MHGKELNRGVGGSTFMPGVLHELASRAGIRSQVMRIGRRPGNDIIVPDLGASKQHAELRRSPTGRYSIIDLGNHNGTYVNGTRVSQQELKGDHRPPPGRSRSSARSLISRTRPG